jgi:phage shock protein A
MNSLWEKINQKLHSIVDRALNASSLALYDQYIRDVEAYGRQLEDSAATIYAGIQANKRRLAQHISTMQDLEARVDPLLAEDESAGRIMLNDLQVQRELVKVTQKQIENQQADYERLLTGREQTQDRLKVISGERPAVENLLAVVRAERLMQQIDNTLAGIALLGETSAAGQIAAGIQRRFNEAELRWQMAAGKLGLDQASVEAEKAQIDAQLTERMKRLGLEEE